jgi:hypothetical protein
MKTSHMTENHYTHLGIMVALSFVTMYILMYAMANSIGDVYASINQAYMAGLMAAPMVVIELVVMRAMYHNVTLNRALIGLSAAAALLLFLFIQQPTAVGDRQFLRSMIPHHSAAILMCRQASLQDARVRTLCQAVISSQQREIDQMDAILRESD